MHEDGIEVLVGDRGRSIIVSLLVKAPADQDISQTADDQRAWRGCGLGYLDERDQFVRELPASEWEQLDEHDARPHGLHGREDRPPTDLLHSIDTAAAVAADEAMSIGIQAKRREGNQHHNPRAPPSPR